MSFNGIAAFDPRLDDAGRARARCEYCGRRDTADISGNCKGCGAPKPRGRAIDVTTIGDEEPQFLFLETEARR